MSNLTPAIDFIASELERLRATSDTKSLQVLQSVARTLAEGQRLSEQVKKFVSRPERRPCHLTARLLTGAGAIDCKVIDLSLGGLGVVINPISQIDVGSEATISCDEIGELTGAIRWGKHPRYGVELIRSAQSRRQLEALFDTLGQPQLTWGRT